MNKELADAIWNLHTLNFYIFYWSKRGASEEELSKDLSERLSDKYHSVWVNFCHHTLPDHSNPYPDMFEITYTPKIPKEEFDKLSSLVNEDIYLKAGKSISYDDMFEEFLSGRNVQIVDSLFDKALLQRLQSNNVECCCNCENKHDNNKCYNRSSHTFGQFVMPDYKCNQFGFGD